VCAWACVSIFFWVYVCVFMCVFVCEFVCACVDECLSVCVYVREKEKSREKVSCKQILKHPRLHCDVEISFWKFFIKFQRRIENLWKIIKTKSCWWWSRQNFLSFLLFPLEFVSLNPRESFLFSYAFSEKLIIFNETVINKHK